jgi:hypothetical protein
LIIGGFDFGDASLDRPLLPLKDRRSWCVIWYNRNDHILQNRFFDDYIIKYHLLTNLSLKCMLAFCIRNNPGTYKFLCEYSDWAPVGRL